MFEVVGNGRRWWRPALTPPGWAPPGLEKKPGKRGHFGVEEPGEAPRGLSRTAKRRRAPRKADLRRPPLRFRKSPRENFLARPRHAAACAPHTRRCSRSAPRAVFDLASRAGSKSSSRRRHRIRPRKSMRPVPPSTPHPPRAPPQAAVVPRPRREHQRSASHRARRRRQEGQDLRRGQGLADEGVRRPPRPKRKESGEGAATGPPSPRPGHGGRSRVVDVCSRHRAGPAVDRFAHRPSRSPPSRGRPPSPASHGRRARSRAGRGRSPSRRPSRAPGPQGDAEPAGAAKERSRPRPRSPRREHGPRPRLRRAPP